MNKQQVMKEANARNADVGVRVRWDAGEGEYVVTVKGNPNADYFTPDWEDAMDSADAMADVERDALTSVCGRVGVIPAGWDLVG